MDIKEENVRKAYLQGCPDVKKVLKNLFPDLFLSDDKVKEYNKKINSLSKELEKVVDFKFSPNFLEIRGGGTFRHQGLFLATDYDDFSFEIKTDNEKKQVLVWTLKK